MLLALNNEKGFFLTTRPSFTIVGNIAVAWFSLGVISPLLTQPKDLSNFLFTFGISIWYIHCCRYIMFLAFNRTSWRGAMMIEWNIVNVYLFAALVTCLALIVVYLMFPKRK